MSTNCVGRSLVTSNRPPVIIGRPLWRPAEDRVGRGLATDLRQPRRRVRRPGRSPPATPAHPSRPEGARPGPGRGPRAAAAAGRGGGHPAPAGPRRSPPAPPPEPPEGAPTRDRRRRRPPCRTPRRTPGPPARSAAPRSAQSCAVSDRLDQASRQLPECRKRAHARFVVARHYVVEAKAEHSIQDERDQDLAINQEANPAIRFDAVDLFLYDLPVSSEEYRP